MKILLNKKNGNQNEGVKREVPENLKQTYEIYQNRKITRNLQKSLLFSSGNKTPPVYTGPVWTDEFLPVQPFYTEPRKFCNRLQYCLLFKNLHGSAGPL